MNPQMGEESRDERCQGSTARWKVGSDEVMDKQLRTKAVKSTLLICSDYLMLCDKLPHNLVGIKQPYAFGSGKLGIQTGHSRKGLSLILDVWAISWKPPGLQNHLKVHSLWLVLGRLKQLAAARALWASLSISVWPLCVVSPTWQL